MKDKLLQIIEHYGILPQLKYFQSEVFELNEAIIYERTTSKYGDDINDYKCIKHIVEEISDVMVMLSQFKEYYGITDDEIQKIMKYKVNRQIERIKKRE